MISMRRDVFLVYDKKLLERSDWYGYTDDCFGISSPREVYGIGLGGGWGDRFAPVRLIKAVNESGPGYQLNEVMFRTGVNNQYLKRIWVFDEGTKKTVINGLREAGFEEFNGLPLDEFVIVSHDVPKI
jgi:hypothetical protein